MKRIEVLFIVLCISICALVIVQPRKVIGGAALQTNTFTTLGTQYLYRVSPASCTSTQIFSPTWTTAPTGVNIDIYAGWVTNELNLIGKAWLTSGNRSGFGTAGTCLEWWMAHYSTLSGTANGSIAHRHFGPDLYWVSGTGMNGQSVLMGGH